MAALAQLLPGALLCQRRLLALLLYRLLALLLYRLRSVLRGLAWHSILLRGHVAVCLPGLLPCLRHRLKAPPLLLLLLCTHRLVPQWGCCGIASLPLLLPGLLLLLLLR